MKKSFQSFLPVLAFATAFVWASPVNAQQPQSNKFWWPEKLDLSPLRQGAAESNPLRSCKPKPRKFHKSCNVYP
ncbi:MAG: hypothetical protein ABI822_31560, partial [Bryobacteraceae bacterium]